MKTPAVVHPLPQGGEDYKFKSARPSVAALAKSLGGAAFHFCPSPFDLLFPALPPCAATPVQISLTSTPMSKGPFAVGGRLAAPSEYIAAEPRRVGAPLVGARKSALPTMGAGTRPAPTSRSSCARCRGTACRPLMPHSPRGTPGRASPASRDCLRPFERRRTQESSRFNSSLVTRHCPSQFVLGIDRGFVIEEKPAVTRALTVAQQLAPGQAGTLET